MVSATKSFLRIEKRTIVLNIFNELKFTAKNRPIPSGPGLACLEASESEVETSGMAVERVGGNRPLSFGATFTRACLGLAPLGATFTRACLGLAPAGATFTRACLGLAPAEATFTRACLGLAPLGATFTRAGLGLAPDGATITRACLGLAPPGANC